MTVGRRFDAGLARWVHLRCAVAFADLSGFVEFTAGFGDEAAAELLALNRLTILPIVDSHDGRVVKHLGDGLLMTFAAAAPAVAAAVAIVDAASDVLPMRAGVHWGHAIAVGPDVVGNDVNLAARVVAAADPGEVLVTGQARRAAGDVSRLTFGPVRLLHPKGVSTPIEVSVAVPGSELIAADA